jgi:hypothetical protein
MNMWRKSFSTDYQVAFYVSLSRMRKAVRQTTILTATLAASLYQEALRASCKELYITILPASTERKDRILC